MDLDRPSVCREATDTSVEVLEWDKFSEAMLYPLNPAYALAP